MVYIVGHRGAPTSFPENTIESFRKAIEFGVDFIECDIHLSKDEQIIVIYDATVNRTTDGKGYIKDFSVDELKRLSIQQAFRIPIIEEVLALDFPILVELKSYDVSGEYQIYPNLVSKLLQVFQESEFKRDAFFMSFNRRYLEQIGDSRFKKVYLSSDFPDLSSLKDLNLFGVGIEYHALDALRVKMLLNRQA